MSKYFPLLYLVLTGSKPTSGVQWLTLDFGRGVNADELGMLFAMMSDTIRGSAMQRLLLPLKMVLPKSRISQLPGWAKNSYSPSTLINL